MSLNPPRAYGISDPLIDVFPKPISQDRAPDTLDIAYIIGQVWVDTSTDAAYILTSKSNASANWEAVAGGAVQLSTISADTGSASPVAGDIEIAGGGGITTSASGKTVTIGLSGGGLNMDSFVPDTGTNPVVPDATGQITMAGTAAQITTTGGLNTLTFSLPAAVIAPGSVQTNTAVTVGDTFTVSAGPVTITSGASGIDISGDAAATTVTLGTGAAAKTVTVGSTNTTSATTIAAGSGNLNLVSENVIQSKSVSATNVTSQVTNSNNASGTSHASYQLAVGGGSAGDPYIDFLVSGAGHFAMGIDNSVNDDFVIAASGSLGTSNIVSWTAAGAMTNAGSITNFSGVNVTNGNLTLSAAGGKLNIAGGSNPVQGQSTLTNGTVMVSNTRPTANSRFIFTRASIGTTGANALGNIELGAVVPNVSFVINSVDPADATSLQTTDQSIINWWIIN